MASRGLFQRRSGMEVFAFVPQKDQEEFTRYLYHQYNYWNKERRRCFYRSRKSKQKSFTKIDIAPSFTFSSILTNFTLHPPQSFLEVTTERIRTKHKTAPPTSSDLECSFTSELDDEFETDSSEDELFLSAMRVLNPDYKTYRKRSVRPSFSSSDEAAEFHAFELYRKKFFVSRDHQTFIDCCSHPTFWHDRARAAGFTEEQLVLPVFGSLSPQTVFS